MNIFMDFSCQKCHSPCASLKLCTVFTHLPLNKTSVSLSSDGKHLAKLAGENSLNSVITTGFQLHEAIALKIHINREKSLKAVDKYLRKMKYFVRNLMEADTECDYLSSGGGIGDSSSSFWSLRKASYMIQEALKLQISPHFHRFGLDNVALWLEEEERASISILVPWRRLN